MATLLKVLSFNQKRFSSYCKVIASDNPDFYTGQEFYVDLTVDAGFVDMAESQLVGKIVEVQRFQPYEFIGVGCSIKEQA